MKRQGINRLFFSKWVDADGLIECHHDCVIKFPLFGFNRGTEIDMICVNYEDMQLSLWNDDGVMTHNECIFALCKRIWNEL